MLGKKRMRNIMIDKIDKILMTYYEQLPEQNEETNAYLEEALKLLDLMKELELVNQAEYLLLRDVYKDYFWL